MQITKYEIVEKVSKKTGNTYEVLVLTFSNGYKKDVFLSDAELYMLKSGK